jgi:hypothetical protein
MFYNLNFFQNKVARVNEYLHVWQPFCFLFTFLLVLTRFQNVVALLHTFERLYFLHLFMISVSLCTLFKTSYTVLQDCCIMLNSLHFLKWKINFRTLIAFGIFFCFCSSFYFLRKLRIVKHCSQAFIIHHHIVLHHKVSLL